jgi:hypothetical protein
MLLFNFKKLDFEGGEKNMLLNIIKEPGRTNKIKGP